MRRTWYVSVMLFGYGALGAFCYRMWRELIKDNYDPTILSVGLGILGLLALLAVAVWLTFNAFDSNIYNVEYGEILDKRWYDAYETPRQRVGGVTVGGIDVGGVTVGGMTIGGVEVGSQHIDARYQLKLRDDHGHTGWVGVTHRTYIHYSIGESIDLRKK